MSATSNGGAAKRVRVIEASDLKANGGSYALSGQPPVRVYGVTDAETKAQGGPYAVEGNIAMPVYIVGTASGTPFASASQSMIAPVPMIGVDSLAAGNVAIPVFVVGGSLGGGAPDAPTNLTAVPTGTDNLQVLLTWDASADATGYIVEYDNGGGWVEIDDTALLTFTHTTPTLGIDTHSYRVRAYNGDGESANATATLDDLRLGLVVYYTLDEVSGARADSVGANDLTDNNTVGSTAGIIGNAALFVDANLESLSHADDAVFNIGAADFSVQAWVRMAASGTGFDVLLGKDGATRDWVLYTDNSNTYVFNLFNAGGSSIVQLQTAALSREVRRQFLISRNAADVALYVDNGVPVTGTISGTPNNSAAAFRIGSNDLNDHFVDGDVDEVGIWKRELSATNRSKLNNGGAGYRPAGL